MIAAFKAKVFTVSSNVHLATKQPLDNINHFIISTSELDSYDNMIVLGK